MEHFTVSCRGIMAGADAATKAFSVPHTSYVVVIGNDRKVVYTGVGDEQNIDAAVAMAFAKKVKTSSRPRT